MQESVTYYDVQTTEHIHNLIVALEAYRAKQYHLGLTVQTLSYANQNRDSRISEKKYFELHRLICCYDEEDDRELTFLTNKTHISVLDIANLDKKGVNRVILQMAKVAL